MAAAASSMDSNPIRHRPVMVQELLSALQPGPGQVLLDGTVGHGGHAAAWLEATGPFGRVIGFDRDPEALSQAASALSGFGDRVTLRHADYRDADAAMAELGSPPVDAVILDLGLGSHQLDDRDRGFAFRFEAPLDMRFDRSGPERTAADLLAHASEPELARILSDYGEERMARRIARGIVEARRRKPLRTTTELAELVRALAPASRRERIDPATRTFQALRIAVNRELDGLEQALHALIRVLPSGGRIAVISFHSLEDRVVKHTLRRLAEPCRCRRGDPCTCGAPELLTLEARRASTCTDQEAAFNPRARSAKLRWGIRR